MLLYSVLVLAAAFGEAVRLRNVVDIYAAHCFAQAAGGLGDDVGVVAEGCGLDDGGAWAGVLDLKMPEPTNTPSRIMIAASAGVATPPAVRSIGELSGGDDILDQFMPQPFGSRTGIGGPRTLRKVTAAVASQ